MESFKIAFRNLIRMKRRSFLTGSLIAIGVIFVVLYITYAESFKNSMIAQITDSVMGELQIHKKGYWEDKVINNLFVENKNLENNISKISDVDKIVPRLESFALASFGKQTKGAIIVGIKPDKETEMTKLSDKVITGKYLSNNDKGVLVSEKLASFFKLSVNDTIVLLGQGYHAATAAGKYPVRGIVHMNSPDLNNKMIYMSLKETRELYSAPEMLSSLSVLLKNSDDMDKIKQETAKKINSDEYETMTWKELMPEIHQAIQTDNISGQFMLGILYMIVGFGVFGTIVMMTAERKKEFGVIVAIGMKKVKLIGMLFYETVFLGLVGILSGMLVALPIIFYLSKSPIPITGDAGEAYKSFGFDPVIAFSTHPHYMISQVLVVLFIVMIAFIYPLKRISKLNPVKSMRN